MTKVEKTIKDLEKKHKMQIHFYSNRKKSASGLEETDWIDINTAIDNINQLNAFLKDIMKTEIFTSKKFHTISIVLKEGYEYEKSKVACNYKFDKRQVMNDITKPLKYSLVFKNTH